MSAVKFYVGDHLYNNETIVWFLLVYLYWSCSYYGCLVFGGSGGLFVQVGLSLLFWFLVFEDRLSLCISPDSKKNWEKNVKFCTSKNIANSMLGSLPSHQNSFSCMNLMSSNNQPHKTHAWVKQWCSWYRSNQLLSDSIEDSLHKRNPMPGTTNLAKNPSCGAQKPYRKVTISLLN